MWLAYLAKTKTKTRRFSLRAARLEFSLHCTDGFDFYFNYDCIVRIENGVFARECLLTGWVEYGSGAFGLAMKESLTAC